MDIFNVSGINVATKCKWETIEGNNNSAVKRKIKTNTLNRDVEYFHASVMELNKNKQASYSKVLNDRRFFKTKIIPLVAFFVFDFRSYVVVKKVKEYKENGVSHSLFWVGVIDPDGLVVEDLLLNEDEVDGKISEYYELEYEVAVYKNDYRPSSSKILIDRIYADDVFEIDEVDFDNLSFNLFKRENYKKYYQLGFLATILLSSGIAFFSMYETDEKKDLIQGNFTAPLSDYQRQLTNWESSQPSSNGRNNRNEINYTQEEVYDLAKKQIQQDFNLQTYENNDIVSNIMEIERSLPTFLVEWQLGNIVFLDGEFVIMYNKIDSSNGVFSELDFIINKYNEFTPFNMLPLSLENDATIRVLEVDFENKIPKNRDLGTGLTLFELRDKQRDEVAEISNRINTSIRKINGLQDGVKDLSTFEQIFTNSLRRTELEINSEVSRLRSYYEEAMEEIDSEFSGFQLDFSISNETRSKYIEMVHLNSMFEWDLPELKNNYPKIEEIDNNYYAKSYEVGVSSIQDLSNNFELMIDAAEQLTEINSIIETVEYNVITGEWIIQAVIYESL